MNWLPNALTFDVEEHFQVSGFNEVIDRRDWEHFPSRVEQSTRRILRLLNRFQTRATFFVLGWVADRHPRLVEEIACQGHEVASHGYWHELIYRQTPSDFAEDLDRSIEAITNACGVRPLGYRAPSFSIVRNSLWALDILRQRGIRYDSSIFPITGHDRYGLSSAQRFAHRIRDDLWEMPASTLRLAGRNLPVAGGGYFRLYPLALTRWAIRTLNSHDHPAVIYLHPWEFDPDQPPVPNLRWRSRFRHYVNLKKTEQRLEMLLQEFDFCPISELLPVDRNAGTEFEHGSRVAAVSVR